MLTATPLNESADGKSDEGTNSGTIACQAGLLTAEPMPSRKVRESKRPGVIKPIKATAPIATATMPIHACMNSNKRRRSTMSANAPAGRAANTTGRLPAVSTRATSRGESVNEVISQLSPTSCIHDPMLETTLAIQRARNNDERSGLQAEASGSDVFSGARVLIFLDDFAIWC